MLRVTLPHRAGNHPSACPTARDPDEIVGSPEEEYFMTARPAGEPYFSAKSVLSLTRPTAGKSLQPEDLDAHCPMKSAL